MSRGGSATRPSEFENVGTRGRARRRQVAGKPDTLPSVYDQDLAGEPPANGRIPPQEKFPNARDTLPAGVGNKSIALKNCHDVLIRDVSILIGGHFAMLLTGADNLTIDNVKIDTNRDGMDIDDCRNVRVSNCSINSPYDDGLCLKSSFGLGITQPTENVTITNCFVTGGLVNGSLLDGTFRKHVGNFAGGLTGAPEFGGWSKQGPATRPSYAAHPSRTGRIKFGTESNGGFRNIAISNCVLDDCEGLAIESVDGAKIDYVTIDNLAMRNIVGSPIFIRLGDRRRAVCTGWVHSARADQ